MRTCFLSAVCFKKVRISMCILNVNIPLLLLLFDTNIHVTCCLNFLYPFLLSTEQNIRKLLHALPKQNIYNANKNIIISSFKSSRNIQQKECGPDRSVSDNQSSSVTLNELAVKAIILYCNFEFQHRSHTMTDINLNGAQITKTV